MRACCSFWVILHAECSAFGEFKTFYNSIIEGDMCYLTWTINGGKSCIGGSLKSKAMIVRSDLNLAGLAIDNGLVDSAMAKLL